MAGTPYDIHLEPGARYTETFEWYEPLATDATQPDLTKPIDLTGWHAQLFVKRNPNDDETLIALDDTLLGGIVVVPAGLVTVSISATQTTILRGLRGAYYDLRLIPPSGVDDSEYLVYGQILPEQRVTV